MDTNGNGRKQRHASAAQLYRLQELNALQLVPIGHGAPVPFEEADSVLADAETRGLWKSRRTQDLEQYVHDHYQQTDDELRQLFKNRRLHETAIQRLLGLAHDLRERSGAAR